MNKHLFYTVLAIVILSFTGCSCPVRQKNNPVVDKQTYSFAVKGTDTLKLDKYEVINTTKDTLSRPVLLFAFGGGFKGGERDEAYYIPYFHFLAENGYVVVSTDYRTELKHADPSKMADPMGFAATLQQAIGAAVEDFYGATRYVVENGDNWKIDPEQIVACGSSAGAITVLQAEYEICNQSKQAQLLPEGFNYAGVISFAGAICSMGAPQWKNAPCPIMLFHGNADRTVPFEKAVLNDMGLWGSNFIARQLKENQSPYYFYLAEDAGHEMANIPMENNRYDILGFLNRFVSNHQKLFINTTETVPGKPSAPKDFTLQDYIRNNM